MFHYSLHLLTGTVYIVRDSLFGHSFAFFERETWFKRLVFASACVCRAVLSWEWCLEGRRPTEQVGLLVLRWDLRLNAVCVKAELVGQNEAFLLIKESRPNPLSARNIIRCSGNLEYFISENFLSLFYFGFLKRMIQLKRESNKRICIHSTVKGDQNYDSLTLFEQIEFELL